MRSDVQLGGLRAWWIWILAVAFVVFLFSFQTGYAIVNSSVQTELGISVAQVATIAAVYTWAFAIFQFFGGAALDRLGAGKILPVAITMVTFGIFLFANAKSFEMLLLSQVVIAVGSCVGFVGAGYVSGQWFGMAKFSFMFGLVQTIAALTSAFSQNLIGFALDSMTWRTLFNFTAAFGVVLMVLGFVFIQDPKPVSHDPKGGIGEFFASVAADIMQILKVGHIWIASIVGALSFGAMLALGVVWMPKLLMVHGLSESTAALGASMLWLGLAVGSATVPYWSDLIHKRKFPILICNAGQLLAFLALLYIPNINSTVSMALCFFFGICNASHMLSFSTAADVVRPQQIGTSASIVNGIMFIVGGILMSRPGVRIGWGIDAGIDAQTLQLAQYAGLPITIALVLAFLVAILMRETYPSEKGDQ